MARPKVRELRYDDELHQVGLALPGRLLLRLKAVASRAGVTLRRLIEASCQAAMNADDTLRDDVRGLLDDRRDGSAH
jgi:hypothetical protein